jgi:hypothetical protein
MDKQTTRIPALLGFDAGMGALKQWLEVAAPNAAPQTFSVEFLSQVALDGVEQVRGTLGLRAGKRPLRVQYDGHSFFVGPKSHDAGRPIESLDYERLTGAPEMIALFYGALTKMADQLAAANIKLADLDLTIVVGLPHGSLKGPDGDKTKVAVKKWMSGDHEWIADETPYVAHVESVKIASQATGALFDYLLDDAGKFIPERKGGFKGEVGVVSVGFNTVELMAIRSKEVIDRFTGGATVGVRRLLDIVNAGSLYSLGELDMLLRAGQLDVATALTVWEREVIGFVERTWGEQWKRFAAVLLVGGGVVLLKETLPYRFNGKAVVPDQPVLTIARGLMKLGKMTTGSRKERTDGNEPADG